jgi:hypothetical protein
MARTLAADDRWLLVPEVGQLAVGCIRFDQMAAKQLEVSLYLDPALKGLGLGQLLLLASEDAMRGRLAQEFTVYARVLPDNGASSRLLKASGYQGGPEQYRKIIGP